MIRIVLDTNVVVSALFVRSGNEARVIEAVRSGLLGICLTEQIAGEYRLVLGTRKFDAFRSVSAEMISMLTTRGTWHVPASAPIVSPDPDDTVFIACAMSARADHLVTGNRRHFPAPMYGTAQVVNAAELLRRIRTV